MNQNKSKKLLDRFKCFRIYKDIVGLRNKSCDTSHKAGISERETCTQSYWCLWIKKSSREMYAWMNARSQEPIPVRWHPVWFKRCTSHPNQSSTQEVVNIVSSLISLMLTAQSHRNRRKRIRYLMWCFDIKFFVKKSKRKTTTECSKLGIFFRGW